MFTWIVLVSLVTVGAGSAVRPVLEAFPLSAISLTPGSQEAEAAELNAEFLRMIDIESMLWTFRQNAGLQPVEGSAPFWGVSRARRICSSMYGDAEFDNKLESWRRAGKIHQWRYADNLPGTTSVRLRFGATTQVRLLSLPLILLTWSLANSCQQLPKDALADWCDGA